MLIIVELLAKLKKRRNGMSERLTQCDRVRMYMQEFGSITQLEAIRDLGVMRLALSKTT